jgi:hypothetical protein
MSIIFLYCIVDRQRERERGIGTVGRKVGEVGDRSERDYIEVGDQKILSSV